MIRTVFFLTIISAVVCCAQEIEPLGDIARHYKTKTAASVDTGSSKAEITDDVQLGLTADAKTDIAAIDKYQAALRKLLVSNRFDELERIATETRTKKTRFSGGVWKIQMFYRGLERPGVGEPARPIWEAHFAKLNQWVAAKPKSVAARISLAEAYASFGWQARGGGYSDTVSDRGWTVHQEYISKARKVLEDAASLDEKCPHWYTAMLSIALAEGWEVEKEATLFKQAITFEPEYYSNARNHLIFLLPKWHGEDTEAAAFAEELSSRIGGDQGQILYFELAVELNRQHDNPNFAKMSWPKIKAGYEAMERKYGEGALKLNQVCVIAVRWQDKPYAARLFDRIGENFDREVWHSFAKFDGMRAWAKSE